MRFYLSSYKVGNEPGKLKALLPVDNPKIGYIPNALDFSTDPARLARHVEDDLNSLRALGLKPEILDLKDYFNKGKGPQAKLAELAGLWISGGNTFVLRQAMKLSGLDELLKSGALRADFLYAGYSAAGCVLGHTLMVYQMVDDPNQLPYPECREVIWEGLGLVDFAFMPHFKSDHPESEAIDTQIQLCISNDIPFRAARDGEVIVIS